MNTDESYLRGIYLLSEIHNGRVKTGAVAERLGVTHPTATDMVEKLAEQGLVDHEKYQGVELTDAGRERALGALGTYCTVQRFLAEILDVDAYQQEAAAIERVIDPDVAARLRTLVDSDPDCPDCFDPVAGRCRQLGRSCEETDRKQSAEQCDRGR